MLALREAGIDLPFYYYGYLMDEQPEGILDYARTYVHPNCVHEWSMGDFFLLCLSEIKVDGKLRRTPEPKICWVDSYAKEECPRVDKPVGGTVVVLPLFSNVRSSYRRRPTQEQVDNMSRLLKQQPRWWHADRM